MWDAPYGNGAPVNNYMVQMCMRAELNSLQPAVPEYGASHSAAEEEEEGADFPAKGSSALNGSAQYAGVDLNLAEAFFDTVYHGAEPSCTGGLPLLLKELHSARAPAWRMQR